MGHFLFLAPIGGKVAEGRIGGRGGRELAPLVEIDFRS